MQRHLIVMTVLFAITACEKQSPPTADAIEHPNPAAVFCTEEDGKYDLDSGLCELPDGTTVDAWKYYRERKS